MNKSKELANRFREVILSGTWIANTNFKHQLEGSDWQMAIKQVGNLNTIALLARHIHYYINGINNVFRGGSLDIKDKFSFDFPEITSQQAWDDFLERFWMDAENFAQFVEELTNQELDQDFVDKKYGTYRRNIEGMIEHSYYHLGQVSLIKKLLQNPS